jgi:hypothetical protein
VGEGRRGGADMALQSREDLDTLSDFCGLFGWAKIKVIGLRYEEISAVKSRQATAAEVAEAFSTVKFGAGREVNVPTAGKMITIWKKMKGCKEPSELIMTSLAEWGRTSFFEEWTKLDVLLAKCSTPTEIQWAFEMLYHTRKAKLRTSNYSRDELQKKKTSDFLEQKWNNRIQNKKSKIMKRDPNGNQQNHTSLPMHEILLLIFGILIKFMDYLVI